jgi:exonuclease SbcC
MIPLTLSITGFGPYKNEQTINFKSMGEAPLFLITGPTGAGKTSVLDAICYALYGRATWRSREVNELRCHHCTLDDKTLVSFDFSARGDIFRVVREPEYQRRALRGGQGGAVTNRRSAMIYQVTYPNGEEALEPLVVRSGQVSGKVQEILGLDVEQFCQVIVLPQGMTRELLTENSRERERVYETLFNTGVYKRIGEALNQRRNKIGDRTQTLTESMKTLLEEADVTTGTELNERVTTLLNQLKEARQWQESLNSKLLEAREAKANAERENQIFNEISEARTTLAGLEAEQPEFDEINARLERHELALPLMPIYESFEKNSEALLNAESGAHEAAQRAEQGFSKLEDARRSEITAKENAADRDSLLRRIAALQGSLNIITRLETANAELNNAITAEAAAQEQLTESAEEVALLTTQVQLASEEISQYRTELANAPNFEAQTLRLERIRNLQNRVNVAQAALTSSRESLEQAQAAYEACIDVHAQANSDFRSLQRNWHLGQAAALAAELQDDTPCPVCGSLDHPAPADYDETSVSTEDIEAGRAAVEAALGDRRAAEERLSNAKTAERAANGDYEEGQAELVASNPEEIEIDTALADIAAQRGAAEQSQSDLEAAEQRLEISNTQLEAAVMGHESLRSTKADATGAVQLARRSVEELTNQLPEEPVNAQVLTTEISRITAQIDTQDTALQEARTALADADRNHAAAQALKTATIGSVETASAAANETTTAWREALDSSAFDSVGDWQLALMDPDIEQDLRSQVAEHSQAIASTQTAIQERQESLEGVAEPHNMNSFDEKIAILTTELDEATQKRDTASGEHAVIAGRLTNFNAYQQQLDEVTLRFGPVDELYRLVNGDAAGRVSLHRHVQSKLLDEVVARANIHYRRMTSSRYSLKRREAPTGGGGHDGLALNIYDTQSARERCVSTLSGGESFQAQTALALGLSESVQAHAGGLQLETLFIDEGFGSLDADALQLAIETLIEIQSSGRYVGVISHVASMNEQIDTQIQVSSGHKGSKIRVVV